jgi:hypothetical protein
MISINAIWSRARECFWLFQTMHFLYVYEDEEQIALYESEQNINSFFCHLL